MKGYWLLSIAALALSSRTLPSQRAQEIPVKTTVCDLLLDPPKWNQKLVEVTGFASHGFEDSGFSDPKCDSRYTGLWMSYGGIRRTGTASTVNEISRTSKATMKVEGIEIPLADDALFERFDSLLHGDDRRGTTVHATVVARFFAGALEHYPNGTSRWEGFGHLGCCSLFVIQQVLSVDDHKQTDVDYSDDPGQPEKTPFTDLLLSWDRPRMLAVQTDAEQGVNSYVFDDPTKVAEGTMTKLVPDVPVSAIHMHKTVDKPFRKVYQVTVDGKKDDWMIVLSRPYWLSMEATDPHRVAWIVLAAYEIGSCTANGGCTSRLK